ncbi:MAG: thioredoxin family protein [Bacteroidetes bacterium]|nr:thioredoxin family protein [Bacteroidota bacterium]
MQTDKITPSEFLSFTSSNRAAAVYFSTPDCNVCKVLKPKFIEFLQTEFPLIEFLYVDVSLSKELSAQQNIFAVPTILFFFDGKEFFRKSRIVNFEELREELDRIYKLLS